jgi:shikimate kinase
MNARHGGRIFLTGFMGCGKSTVAPLLAGLLGYDCLDIDAEIERRTGSTVSGIFARRGERAFRELEREVLFGTAGRRRLVMALGGGTAANEANFAFVRSAGLLVYLKVDFEVLFARLATKEDRPLLVTDDAGGGTPPERLRAAMRRLMSEREPYYERADVVVVPDPRDASRTAALIAGEVSRISAGGIT